jgi:hypothetical protein
VAHLPPPSRMRISMHCGGSTTFVARTHTILCAHTHARTLTLACLPQHCCCTTKFNPNGATESDGNLQNLGLTPEQGAEVSAAYWAYMNVVYEEVVKRGKFSWQLLWTGQKDCAYKNDYSCLGTTGTNYLVTKNNCAATLRAQCTADSQSQKRAMMFPFQGSTSALTNVEEDLASFLLIRGPNAFIGHAWKGCSKQ